MFARGASVRPDRVAAYAFCIAGGADANYAPRLDRAPINLAPVALCN